jgi:hypothetical protein
MTDTPRLENDLIIHYIELVAYNGKEYDLTLLRGDLSIQEGIFENCIHGFLTITDSKDLINLLPIIGEETLKISFTRPDEEALGSLLPDYTHEFEVYKVSDRKTINAKTQSYTLYFCSKEFLTDSKTKFCRGYIKKTPSEIVQNIFETKLQDKKPLTIENTLHPIESFVVPNWTPLKAINHLASKAISENTFSSYVFFESQKTFKFLTIEELLKQEPKQIFNYRISNVLDEGDVYKPRSSFDFKRVQKFEHNKHLNSFEQIKTGFFSGRLITIDPLNRSWDFDSNVHNMSKNFNKYSHLGKEKPFLDSSKHFQNKDGESKDSFRRTVFTDQETNLSEYFWNRRNQLYLIDLHKIVLNLQGDTRIYAGDVIQFELPSMYGDISKSRPEELDQYLSGKYLVTSVRHIITQTYYKIAIEIVKDSYVSPITHIDPSQKYSNIY